MATAAPFPSPTSKWHTTAYPSISPTRPELSAKGKTVLVTGGGSGVGAETARYFAAAGASRIALLGRREQPLLDTKASIEQNFQGVDVFVASTDISKKSEVDTAFSTFASRGKIDILVSNAAVQGPREPLGQVDSDEYFEALRLNLGGALFLAQAFLRFAAEDAIVMDVNSSAAHFNFAPEFGTYSIAKLGIFRFWDSFAFGNPKFSVFHIQPGIIPTAMNKEVGGVDAVGFQDHVSLPAGFIVWCSSNEASFLKNKFLWANWDVDELKAQAKEIETSQRLNIGLAGWPFQNTEWKQPNWSFTRD